jgi:hypothetical protein
MFGRGILDKDELISPAGIDASALEETRYDVQL